MGAAVVEFVGRIARCYCDKERPSSEVAGSPGFQACGPGSREARERCRCGYDLVAHTPEGVARNVDPRTVIERGRCQGFRPRGPLPFDRFWCGCGYTD